MSRAALAATLAALLCGTLSPASAQPASDPFGPGKDRTLFRSESTSRVRWWRDGRTLVQVLAIRRQTPKGLSVDAVRPAFADAAADMDEDRDDYRFEHPLIARYRDCCGFSMGDSLTLSLPEGRRIQAAELQIVPTVADLHRMGGSLWIEPATGALVRAGHRLPDTFDAFHSTGVAWVPESETPARMPATFRWGWQRTDLVRYNRVEGLSVGARGQIYPDTPVGPLSLTATIRLGSADREPNARLDVTRETLRRRVTLSGYHELAAVDEGARHLGIGNSVTALLFGRDDGDYYLRTGGALEWTPPASERASFRVRAFAERHEPVSASTDFALRHLGDDAWRFRLNLAADEGWDVGGEVTLAPWWGSDPREAQGGLQLATRVGLGTWSYRMASLVGRAAVPMPAGLRVTLESRGGTSWESPPAQRTFLLGGATTLRGYEPGSLRGRSFARARGELARRFSFGAVRVFSDGAWAGEREDFDVADALWSAGVGLSLVDGLIRVDAAWGLREPRGFRLELYLDGH